MSTKVKGVTAQGALDGDFAPPPHKAQDVAEFPLTRESQARLNPGAKTVLHITREYPDANRQETTHAVKNLVREVTRSGVNARQIVISLTRTSLPWKCNVIDGDGLGDKRVISMRYWGLPLGILLSLSMYVATLRIVGLLKRRGIEADVIHAHKFGYVGLVGYWLSKRLDKPLIMSIRGGVEQKIFRYKPYYRLFSGKVFRHCSRIYFISAWYRPKLNQFYALPQSRQKLLPNFVNETKIHPRPDFRKNHFISILHLDIYKKKGLPVLLRAFAELVKETPDARLDIVGRGTPATIRRLHRLVASLGLENHVRIEGPVDNAELLDRLPGYAAMCLPSRDETFGMVYVEALFGCVPILYSDRYGVAGYLEGIEGAVGADCYSVNSVTDGLRDLVRNQEAYRSWLIENRDKVVNRFSAERYAKEYDDYIKSL